MILFKYTNRYNAIIFILWIFYSLPGYSQEEAKKDVGKVAQNVYMNAADDSNIILQDTSNHMTENSPLDIQAGRGIYIMADENKLQMRIMGSIRFSAFYDNRNMTSPNSFSTYLIPTGDNSYRLANYYNSLNFSRLGFEVTRKTAKGDFFTRLEMDFAGPGNTFRIRQAYGQYGHFLVGQTWSLMSNVTSLPAMVDPAGPVGAVKNRTPQMRYSKKMASGFYGSFALEYSLPEYNGTDSVDITFVQTIPNITSRFSKQGKSGSIQISTIIAPISGVDPSGTRNNSFGYGASVSGSVNLKKKDVFLFQGTYGLAISHFINPFSGQGQDMVFDPVDDKIVGLYASGAYISYGHNWPRDISSYFSFGMASVSNRNFQSGSDFDYSYGASGNAFWQIVDGLRIGLEYLYGKRINIDGTHGNADRLWALFYYDF